MVQGGSPPKRPKGNGQTPGDRVLQTRNEDTRCDDTRGLSKLHSNSVGMCLKQIYTEYIPSVVNKEGKIVQGVQDQEEEMWYSEDLGKNRFYGLDKDNKMVIYVIKGDDTIVVQDNPSFPGVTVAIGTKSGDYQPGDIEIWMHCPVIGCKKHGDTLPGNQFKGEKQFKGHFTAVHDYVRDSKTNTMTVKTKSNNVVNDLYYHVSGEKKEKHPVQPLFLDLKNPQVKEQQQQLEFIMLNWYHISDYKRRKLFSVSKKRIYPKENDVVDGVRKKRRT